MSSIVIDVLLIKTIERTIKRKLDDLDIEAIYHGEPIFVQKQDGEWLSYMVPLYRMPYDLMPKEVDMALIDSKQFNPNVWESAIHEVITHAPVNVSEAIRATYE